MQHKKDGYYIWLINMHGLLRGEGLEIGNRDTGGQHVYLMGLVRALAAHPAVGQVDVFTRRNPTMGPPHEVREQIISPTIRIVRLDCGGSHFLFKEALWPYLDEFVTQALAYSAQRGRLPDFVHSHYADAGYVGVQLASKFDVPLIHTGHSLGRDKLRAYTAKGFDEDQVMANHHLQPRIEAEEQVGRHASLVIASTRQEAEEQYGMYSDYSPDQITVIPPGVDIERFSGVTPDPAVVAGVDAFLRDPQKPMVLALARPDRKKNLAALVQAFGQTQALRDKANLVLVAGCRDDIAELADEPRHTWEELLHLIDTYGLYGECAYPKKHRFDNVPSFYRLAALRSGVFVNPAFTEPFGLTLLEATASGLPIVATKSGGARDIVAACQNGLLIDPHDIDEIATTLLSSVSQSDRWRQWVRDGQAGVERHYSWALHVELYLSSLEALEGKRGAARTVCHGDP